MKFHKVKTIITAAIALTSHNKKYFKLFQWTKLLSTIGGAQMLIQAVNLLSGIIVVRLLSTKEYAVYTIAYTMLGTMNILTDSGISTVVMHQGGKFWQNKNELGSVLNTGLYLRRKFAVASLVTIIPVMIYLLRNNGSSIIEVVLVVIAVIPPFFATLSGSLLEIPIKLHQKLNSFQKIQIVSNVVRFILVLSILFLTPWAWVAIVMSAIPQQWANLQIKKLSENYVNVIAPIDKVIEGKMIRTVKYILPATIYKSFSGQIAIWISSIVGSAYAIAQIGAIGRIAVAVKSLNVIVSSVIVPRFARLDNKKIVFKRFVQLQVMAIMLSFIVIIIVWLSSDYILIIFGDKYSKLSTECVLMSAEGCICILGDMAYSLNSSRGIILHPIISVFCQFALLIILILTLPINTLSGIIILSIGINGFTYFMHLMNFLSSLKLI